MKRKILIISGVIAVLALVFASAAQASTQSDLAKVRKATARFHSPEAAKGAGYDLRPGLDHCFNNPGVGAMGFHYINTDILDLTVDLLHPEAMVYVPSPNGLQLGAVEYIVPAQAWDDEYDELPQLLGETFGFNEALGVYVLHAWVWKNNPSGIFEDWNRNVSCP
jgi:hypothetical protein